MLHAEITGHLCNLSVTLIIIIVILLMLLLVLFSDITGPFIRSDLAVLGVIKSILEVFSCYAG